ncbi:antibiotic biosynthesis monooxygenase [Actimicrobium sp. CCC2.4]|uniref:antibiotic biosynthesis monooxygenase family protein n=1 Tax=Actimicrobium sp. CCC2.4 TaxID=3048606 RepID=UPI002AC9C654|nr:antibiotic biosynthesis monooxygenase [Actimicrobium sp. CCC2.4]MEB0134628.1 antibiotic biosynthesis monooxygenase [Actimicrobium sp. CCC2.4]WPX30570.1 antibiotic biosynthesis monooxygenase [Actimicrobium sp. CCC2.4]
MILEVADITIQEDRKAQFEDAVAHALATVFPRATGFRGHTFHRCIESPRRYVLQLTWDTLEDHTLGFRGSPLYDEWRSLVGDCFAQPPHVEHFELI